LWSLIRKDPLIPLTILQTCYSRSWGGLEMQALEVSLHLARRGHCVWLSAPPGSNLDEEGRSAGLHTLPMDVRGHVHPMMMVRILRALSRLSVEIVHSHHSKDLATLAPSLRLLRRRIPLVLSKRMGSGVRKTDPLHRLIYSRVDRVLAISSVIRQNVVDTTPMDPGKVLLLFDAVDTDRFEPSRVNDRERIRRDFGVAPGEMLIGTVGRFSPGKGHEELLEATRILAARGLQFKLLIAGEASYGERDYEQRIRALAQTLGLERIVRFTGFRRDVPEIMSALDLFVFPSHAEAFGLVLIEAMAMERPVVSTNCDGVLDIVVDGVTGLTVPPKDPVALAAAIERMLADGTLRDRSGKAGRQRVLEMFDQEKQIDRLESIYAELIEATRPPAAPSR
jgi:glycosyltransferase involved in cell wall biosynthesis